MTLGEKIKEYRQKAGLTQKELADKLYVTYQAVSKWENNDADPSIDMIKSMCEIFECSTDELINPDKKIEEKEVEVVEKIVIKEPDPILAVCQICGRPIYDESEICRIKTTHRTGSGRHHHYVTDEKVICSDCNEEKEKEERKKQEEQNRQKSIRVQKKIKLAYVIPSLVTAVFLAIAIGMYIKGNSNATVLLVIGILLFPTIACFILGNNMVGETWLDIASWSIKLPGIIFSWDIEGCAFFIAMKVLFMVIGFFFGIFTFCLATGVAMLFSIFIYPFALARMYRGEEDELI